MPDPTLTDALKEAYAACPDNVVLLHTLQFDHVAFTQPIRLVLNTESITATLEDGTNQATFVAANFELTLPEVSDAPVPEVQIAVDNVDREILLNIEAAMADPKKITVTYRPYLSTDLSEPQMNPPMTMQVKHIEADLFRVTARAGFADLSNKRFPGEEYDTLRFAGLAA